MVSTDLRVSNVRGGICTAIGRLGGMDSNKLVHSEPAEIASSQPENVVRIVGREALMVSSAGTDTSRAWGEIGVDSEAKKAVLNTEKFTPEGRDGELRPPCQRHCRRTSDPRPQRLLLQLRRNVPRAIQQWPMSFEHLQAMSGGLGSRGQCSWAWFLGTGDADDGAGQVGNSR